MNGESFVRFGENAGYLAELYQLYLSDPSLVDPKWVEFFESLDRGAVNGLTNGHANGHTNGHGAPQASASATASSLGEKLLSAYRTYGHTAARLSPLVEGGIRAESPVELTSSYYGETRDPSQVPASHIVVGERSFASCAELVSALQQTYCGPVGFEFMHLTKSQERTWIQSRIEGQAPRYSAEERKLILKELIRAELFESELHRKYVGTKRFSLEGNDTLIPLLSVLTRRAASMGVKGIVCGMAHRGRLNVLANTIGKPLPLIFGEFEDKTTATIAGAGDVKYHLGYETHRSPNGAEIGVSVVPNPSHLEFVNPVVEGIVRALQDKQDRENRGAYLPLAMHGDAAFAGQGIVFETINYSGVGGYYTGGTYHIVINNQIGFTTTPDESRSTRYCTDLAKGIDCPVFHVNAEDPEAACWVAEIALEYRMAFGKDVFIDLIGHRKHGHNEGDDPSFTQPATYAEVKGKKLIWQQYAEALISQGIVNQEEVDSEVAAYKKEFAAAAEGVGSSIGTEACGLHGHLEMMPATTGVEKDTLREIARSLTTWPQGFKPHPKLQKIIEKRVETVEVGEGIEWGVAEALAFGSLLLDGRSVRLSGQDCCRGTFSHRHLVLDHYEGAGTFSPLRDLGASRGVPGVFEVFNSTLSEAAVLGFEFGYAATKTDTLTMWEAQFGDFANGAQVIIDQFVSSSESKWGQPSGVVLMLPHGYEGQGPEHSSARLERYLQMCAEGNMRVCYPSTAAQHFHLLRRQGLSELKRPLIIMTPKSLLRLPSAMSSLSEMTTGGFQPTLQTDLSGSKKVKNLVFLSGKIYHDVVAALQSAGKASARLVRIEELYPFPEAEVASILKDSGAERAFWVQEEPQNMGAWSYIAPRLRDVLGFEPVYVGRAASAATAAGSSKHHALEHKAILTDLAAHLAK